MRLVKEIVSRNFELHFRRWAILETRWFNIYIHRIYKGDEDEAPHNHPWKFFNIILWGKYEEFSIDATGTNFGKYVGNTLKGKKRTRRPLSMGYSPIRKFHKISLEKPVTSLVITGAHKKEWGYLVPTERTPIIRRYKDNEAFRKEKNEQGNAE